MEEVYVSKFTYKGFEGVCKHISELEDDYDMYHVIIHINDKISFEFKNRSEEYAKNKVNQKVDNYMIEISK